VQIIEIGNTWIGSELIGIGIIFIGIFTAVLVKALYSHLLKKATLTHSKFDDVIILSFEKPLIIFIVALAVYVSIKHFFTLPDNYAWIIQDKSVTASIIFLTTWLIANFTHHSLKQYGSRIAVRTKNEFDDQIFAIFEKMGSYIIWFLGILIILTTLELDISPLIAGAGVAGLAFALAAQEILSNVLAGTVIVVDQPLKVHDRVKIDNYFGDVVSVGPRSTRILTIDDQLITIPNTTVTSSIITNYAMPEPKLAVNIPVSVAYGSDVEKILNILVEIVSEAAKNIEYILENPAPQVFFLEFGASSLNFRLKVWTNDFRRELYTISHINRHINERFTKEGIQIPFTQVDVRLPDIQIPPLTIQNNSGEKVYEKE
jgi:MscS family membrane protein